MAARTPVVILREIAQVRAAKELKADTRQYLVEKLQSELEAIVEMEKRQGGLPGVPPVNAKK